MKSNLITALAAVLLCISAGGQTTPMADAYKAAGPDAFAAGRDWYPYPSYEDRKGWAEIFGDDAKAFIARGEKRLDYTWLVAMASDYLDYERTGSRARMQHINECNHTALCDLTLAELAEGKGRFIDKIVDGLWMMSEKTTWVHSYHQPQQPSKRALPDSRWVFIDLGAHQWGSDIAVVWHFLHKEFDKIDPSISYAVQQAMDRQIFSPFLDLEKEKTMNWIGIARQSKTLNNWCIWGNANIMLAFLLMEQDNARLHQALERSVASVDLYMNSVKADGACDEGPGYWTHAAGKLRDYARIMYDASGGKFNIFGNAQARAMGEYASRVFLGDGWTVNFSDGSARATSSVPLTYFYGCDFGSKELKDYSIYLNTKQNPKSMCEMPLLSGSYDLNQKLDVLRYRKSFEEYASLALDEAGGNIKKMLKNLRAEVPSFTWYPETRHLIAHKDKWALGAKSGYNHESHNHNDVGSFILFYDNVPVFIDSGSTTYVKDTFGPNRYKIWAMQSSWHNLPDINGKPQKFGFEYAAKDDFADKKKLTFRTDISGAYPKSAACSKWVRSYALSSDGLTISDEYALTQRVAPDAVHFLVSGTVKVLGSGEIAIEESTFDKGKTHKFILSHPKSLTATVETKELDDKKLSKVWGPALHRITLTSSSSAPLKGEYVFKVKAVN